MNEKYDVVASFDGERTSEDARLYEVGRDGLDSRTTEVAGYPGTVGCMADKVPTGGGTDGTT